MEHAAGTETVVPPTPDPLRTALHRRFLAATVGRFGPVVTQHPEQAADVAMAVVSPGTGVLRPAEGSPCGEQAIHATAVLRDRYADKFEFWAADDEFTHLFEIVYPGNRIVVDYATTDDLFYLGNVHIASGRTQGPAPGNGWPGPQATVFKGCTLGHALSMDPRPNAEGIVVHYWHSDLRIKIKQDDYVALHRILTMTTARTVWEYLAVDACKHLISQPKHWGSRLGIDPARAAEILAVGPDWLAKLTEGVPDEFHGWLRSTIDGLRTRVGGERASLTAHAAQLRDEHGADRKAFALAAKDHPHAGALFLLLDDRDITTYLWRSVYPPAEKAWGARSEDVA